MKNKPISLQLKSYYLSTGHQKVLKFLELFQDLRAASTILNPNKKYTGTHNAIQHAINTFAPSETVSDLWSKALNKNNFHNNIIESISQKTNAKINELIAKKDYRGIAEYLKMPRTHQRLKNKK